MSVSKDSQNTDCIANNIPSRAFRYATESKNVLSSAGAMYIGTGKTRTTTITINDGSSDGGSVSYDSYITAILKCPQATGYLYTIHKVWLFETGVIDSIPASYNTSTSYTVGNIVLYDDTDTFYRCISETSGDFDSEKWEIIADYMFLPCWEKGADVWVPTLVDGVSIWEDINGDLQIYSNLEESNDG